jgi:cell division ATPase FtsA
MTYSTPYEAAEEIKLNFANAVPETVRPDDEVIVPVNGRSTGLRVPRHEICQLTRERAQELARLVNIKLRDAGVNRSETTTLVLTGGASNLHGLQPMMQKYFAGKIRQGTPGASLNLPNALRHPAYSTSVGIFLWSVNNYRQEPYKNGSYRTNGHNGANGYNNTNGHNGANGHAVSANGHNGTNGNAAVATYDANGGGLGRLFKSLRKKR